MADTDGELINLRLDKWLWAARFYKTRALAADAVKGGKVHVNQQRVKPAKLISTADQLEITKGVEVFVVDVKGLNDKRRPAVEARQLYAETPESLDKREEQKQLRKFACSGVQSTGKPNKHERKKSAKMRGKWG